MPTINGQHAIWVAPTAGSELLARPTRRVPLEAARCRAVLPLEFCMSVSAPAASSAVTTSRCPFAAALCSAVVPFCACHGV